jgi:ArsR family transcriptional regulator, arsenate/arsenite/antimonite-responsive transcriptional repressor
LTYSGLRVLDRARISELLAAVGDPARLDIIFLLGETGRMNVGDIASRFHLSRPAISHHLKVLKTSGVVTAQKVGQEVFYELDEGVIIHELRTVLAGIEEAVRQRACSAVSS